MYKLYLFILIFLTGCGLSQTKIKEREEYLYRAETYYNNKKYMNSLTQLDLALEIDPQCKRAHIAKGWAYYYLSQYDKAEESFQAVLPLDDSDPWVHYGLGSLNYKRSLRSISNLAKLQAKLEAAKTQEEKKKIQKQFEGALERHEKEKELWLTKSLEHLQKAKNFSTELIDLHKLIALVYISKGQEFYPKAIECIDEYLNLLDKEHKSFEDIQKQKETARSQPGLKQQERETLDLFIENTKDQKEENRKQYRVAQAIAAERLYFLALWEASEAKKAGANIAVKKRHEIAMKRYAADATQRIQSILKTAPESANQYRNLASLAQLQGKFDDAAKYLREYIAQYPLADPTDRAKVKLDLESLEKKK